MIVSDTNLIAYLLLGGSGLSDARSIYRRDPGWAAPLLWRSELRNVLAGYLRRGEMDRGQAVALQAKAEEMMTGREHVVPSEHVLRFTAVSKCSAYDCEFVALAAQLKVPLVTSDRQILRDFPGVAVAPSRFLST